MASGTGTKSINKSKGVKRKLPTETDDPIPFSQFGQDGRRDRHLQSALRSLGNPRPHRDEWEKLGPGEFKPLELAKIWLADQHLRGWDSHSPEVKSWLVADLLDKLYSAFGGFDPLLETLFSQRTPWWYFEVDVDYLATAMDILRTFGLMHSFSGKHRRPENILDFPLQNYWRVMYHYEDNHLVYCPRRCECFISYRCSCPRGCRCQNLCRCVGRPVYAAFYNGLPEVVRVLLNLGASLPLDDLCRCSRRYGGHPLVKLFFRVYENGQVARRPLDLFSLRLLLADLPASFRHTVRSRFPYFADDIEDVPSLKHVARASIRHQLRAARSIGRPGALERCGLPKCLQSYIYLEDVGIGV